jgi:hypothetical protein
MQRSKKDRYSTTSSARPINSNGTLMPSAVTFKLVDALCRQAQQPLKIVERICCRYFFFKEPH